MLQTDNHASTPPLSFLQAGCPSCRPTNSVKALKALSGELTEMYPVENNLQTHTVRLQTCSNARLVGNNSNSSAFHSSEPDNNVLGVVCHYLKEVTLVNDLHETQALFHQID